MSEEQNRISTFGQAVEAAKRGTAPEQLASQLYDQMTERERVWLLGGDLDFWPGMRSFVEDGYNVFPYVMGEVKRLGLPGLRFVDGPRGAVVGNSTAFPVSMARGATWDVALEERIGEAIGKEIREQGGNFFGGVCINLPWHPSWGRSQEAYSDQPVVLGEMGAALTRGIQKNAMACVKHFAVNSMENGRFSVDVTVDEDVFQEIYLPHFHRVIREGVFAVMGSYNSINGEWAGQNPYTLTQVLRDDWDFTGVTITDFIWGMRDPVKSLVAGMDVEAPFNQQRGAWLMQALEEGRASWEDVRRSALRILATEIAFYAQRDQAEPSKTVVSSEHVQLAREAAARAIVLLKNDVPHGSQKQLLPLAEDTKRIAVFGALADKANTGDHGSSDVRAPYVVTPLEGIRSSFPETNVTYVPGGDSETITKAASDSDVAIVVVGYTAEDEGEFVDGGVATRPELKALYPEPTSQSEKEDAKIALAALASGASVIGSGTAGGDRRDLHLRDQDVQLINQVAAANENTVVLVVNAGAVLLDPWHDTVPAIMYVWYSGMEGGNGIADVLTGKHNPSGRLPYALPKSVEDIPPLDIDAKEVQYERLYGQSYLEAHGKEALYPLGYGLSYGKWVLGAVQEVTADKSAKVGSLTVEVSSANGPGGQHVVQIYGTREGVNATEPGGGRRLLGFTAVEVAAGETKIAKVDFSLEPLGTWDAQRREIVVGEGPVLLEAASYWGDPDAAQVKLNLA